MKFMCKTSCLSWYKLLGVLRQQPFVINLILIPPGSKLTWERKRRCCISIILLFYKSYHCMRIARVRVRTNSPNYSFFRIVRHQHEGKCWYWWHPLTNQITGKSVPINRKSVYQYCFHPSESPWPSLTSCQMSHPKSSLQNTHYCSSLTPKSSL